MKFETGWFGVPGETYAGENKVHAVFTSDKEPICGRGSLRRVNEFQVCATGIHMDYITCKRCMAVLGSKRWRERYASQSNSVPAASATKNNLSDDHQHCTC